MLTARPSIAPAEEDIFRHGVATRTPPLQNVAAEFCEAVAALRDQEVIDVAHARLPGSQPLQGAELASRAAPGVTAGPLCPGCGRTFRPTRSTQRHCYPGCRVAAFRKRHHAPAGGNSSIPNKKAANTSQESAADSQLRASGV